jgi:hypothetical protein
MRRHRLRVSENVMLIGIFVYVPIRQEIRALWKYYVMMTSVILFLNYTVKTIKKKKG